MKRNNYKVISAHEIEEKKLIDFYKIVYPHRLKSLINSWKWLNRSDYYNNSAPLIMIDQDGDIISHFGMMPFKMVLDNEIYNAHWLIDFVVHPDYRRAGLGHIITNKIMGFSDIQVTCCNEKAIKIFIKLGMITSDASFYHLFFIKPFNHKKLRVYFPSFIRRIFNFMSNYILSLLYEKRAFPKESIMVEELNDYNVKSFINSNMKGDLIATTDRNSSYLNWRLVKSPDKNAYRIFSSKSSNIRFIIKLSDKKKYNCINILMQNEPVKDIDIIRLISSLALWGNEHGYDYVDYYTSRNQRSKK